jgi:thiol-disulfide isomerase/thioredoxin
VKKSTITGIVFAAALSVLFSACSKPKPVAGTWTVGNNQQRLSDYKGKVVVLDFYATWCEPCRAETPRLVKLQKQYGAVGLQVIALNVGGDEDRSEVPKYAKEFSIEYPLGFPDDNLVDQYLADNQNIPQSFIFNRNGDLIKRFVGYSPDAGDDLEKLIQQALQAK